MPADQGAPAGPSDKLSSAQQPAVVPADQVAPAVASDGLSTLAIVLISVGGALALAGIAYTAVRVIKHGHAAA